MGGAHIARAGSYRRDAARPARAEIADQAHFNAEEVAEREELTPDEQLMELERTRDELLAFVRGLAPATLARRQLWDTWAGTLPSICWWRCATTRPSTWRHCAPPWRSWARKAGPAQVSNLLCSFVYGFSLRKPRHNHAKPT